MNDKLRILAHAKARDGNCVQVRWSDGIKVSLDLSPLLKRGPFRGLRDAKTFVNLTIGDWGHSLQWPGEIEMSAETLWLMTLTATGHDDARQFLEWRLRNGLSLSKAADALGISRRMVAYYSGGEKEVPKSILLACKGWESEQAAA